MPGVTKRSSPYLCQQNTAFTEEGAMLAKVWTCAVVGLEGELVQV
jgi:hypothetical protein